ncbi:uncharacterized protein [Aristolochia californica]|uniref:uncharacterized protein n=1 Tax=Aristolochia californica TaxID=171875 RepID=UPI0035D81CC4
MNSVFSEQILADKLSKLNSTQHCIETLSHWCIFHQHKAELVVETWSKQFHSSENEKKVPFLYLANDILQNSRRKGTEFVSEFWKVLPSALKDVAKHGDDRGKNALNRLVSIWEERKVFGSRARGLKDLMLGEEPPPPLELNKKRSRSVRIVKRDSRSLKIKVAIGGTAEKIVSAFHAVLSEHVAEDSELTKCKTAVRRVQKMEKDVNNACKQEGDSKRTSLGDELKEQETLLKQCIDKLKTIEENRLALVSHLKEALREQESELENVRTQLQVAQAQVEEATNMRRRLNNESPVGRNAVDTSTLEETNKRTAAAIADKLAASTSSFQMMSSILSTFAAEEAKNVGLMTSTNQSISNSNMEKPVSLSSAPAFIAVQSVPGQVHQQPQSVLGHQQLAQTSTSQVQYQLGPPQQYLQSSMTGVPYAYSSMPPPPSLSQQQYMSYPGQAPVPQQPMQAMPLPQQQVAPPSYRTLQPPGMQFFTYQNHG